MIDIKDVKEQARKEVADEEARKAKNALVAKLKARAAAQQIVKNLDREIEDLEQAIADGSFVG